MRTAALLVAAAGVLVEAVAFGALLLALGEIIGAYSMSLNGAPVDTSQTAVRVLAVVLAAMLVTLAVALLVAALRRRPFGRPTRVLVIAALVVQWFLAVIAGTTLDMRIFAGVLVVFGALLYALLANGPSRPRQPTPEQPPRSTPSAA
jgi:hypothetical protein